VSSINSSARIQFERQSAASAKKNKKIKKISLALPMLGDSGNPRISLIIAGCYLGRWRKKGHGAHRKLARGRTAASARWVLIQFSSFQPAGKSNRVVAEQRASREICTFQFAECFRCELPCEPACFNRGVGRVLAKVFDSLLLLTKSWSPE
jgi:hypothetical protein